MYYFIVNEKGGGGAVREHWKRIRAELKNAKVDYKVYFTTGRGDAKTYAQRICQHDAKDIRLVAVGGDGTVNEVLNGITDFNRVSLGVIPLGSGNDFATSLGISKDPHKALSDILSCDRTRKIDYGEVVYETGETRRFGISAGVGMDAIVCKKAQTGRLKKRLRIFGLEKLTYVLLTVETILTMQRLPVRVAIGKKKPVDIKSFIYLAALNMPAEGGGVKMAPHASYTDGKLTMCLGHSITKLTAPVALIRLVLGKHESAREFIVKDGSAFTIESPTPLVLHTDGEYGGEVNRLTFRCIKRELGILGTSVCVRIF